MRRLSLPVLLGLALAVCPAGSLARAQQPAQPPSAPSTEDLKKDIDSLKETLKSIQKDLQDIKTLLTQARQPAGPQQVISLDLANRPFRGDKAAKVTLVEFTDYQ